ncbi:MAG TPA: sigma-70 family RNA polymerase sigma factor [Caulifigura sp.]|jgi:RNA polymerase sigma-70 factor (ECF subfamily)|nr:sigma-70 family RNA polymerase sigma factor [Caulifigura sp.]
MATTTRASQRVSSERAAHETEPQDTQASDARLVEEARRGLQSSFAKLVQRYERRLIRVIGRFIRDADQAEDLAQETFLRVYERLDQFDPSRRFGPWLFRIGVNLCLDHHRRRKRRIWGWLFSDSGTENWPDPAVEDPRGQQDTAQEVQAVIAQIAEKYRVVLVLRDMENFSTSEIAAILNRREATIRWRLAEARIRFQQLWEVRQGIARTDSRAAEGAVS